MSILDLRNDTNRNNCLELLCCYIRVFCKSRSIPFPAVTNHRKSRPFLAMLLRCFLIRKWKPRCPLINACRPTDFPMTACKQNAPESNRRHKSISKHPNCKSALSTKCIPGISIEGAEALEHSRHDQRGYGIGCLGVRFISRDGFGGG